MRLYDVYDASDESLLEVLERFTASKAGFAAQSEDEQHNECASSWSNWLLTLVNAEPECQQLCGSS